MTPDAVCNQEGIESRRSRPQQNQHQWGTGRHRIARGAAGGVGVAPHSSLPVTPRSGRLASSDSYTVSIEGSHECWQKVSKPKNSRLPSPRATVSIWMSSERVTVAGSGHMRGPRVAASKEGSAAAT